MAAGTVYPTGTPTRYVATSGWSAFGTGVAQVWATYAASYLADSNDLTWVQMGTAPATGRGYVISNISAIAVTAGSGVARARVAGRMSGQGGFTVDLRNGGTTILGAISANNPSGTAVIDYSGGWTNPPTAGTTWATATLNAGSVYVDTNNTNLKVLQLRMEYDMVSLPTAVVAASVNTDKSVVSWTYTDTDQIAQSSAVVKIYTAAQYGAAGFSPDTSTATFSTTLSGAGTTVTSTAALANATVFRAYVLPYKNYQTLPIPGSWAFVAGTVSYSAPNAGTISPVWDETFKRVAVTVSGSASPFRYTITRNDGGTVGSALATMGTGTNGTVVLYDYQAPRGTSVVYSLILTTGPSASPQLSSSTTNSTVTTGTATTWEVQSLAAPTTVYQFNSPVTGISFQREEGQTVFRPLDATKAVVVSGAITGDDGSVNWMTTSRSAWETLKTVLTAQSPLRITSPFIKAAGGNESWIIRLTSRSWDSSGVPANPIQSVTASFVEVSPVDYGL